MATLTTNTPSVAQTAAETASQTALAPKRQYPGALVVVEGIDGSGKSTQLYLLKRWLEINGYRIHFTEWNSSPLVKSATRRGKQRRLLTPTTFSLLHAADFADRCERQILPLLHGGYLVLADRYIYTAFARDAARGCSPNSVTSCGSEMPQRFAHLCRSCDSVRVFVRHALGENGWNGAGGFQVLFAGWAGDDPIPLWIEELQAYGETRFAR